MNVVLLHMKIQFIGCDCETFVDNICAILSSLTLVFDCNFVVHKEIIGRMMAFVTCTLLHLLLFFEHNDGPNHSSTGGLLNKPTISISS